MFKQCKSIGNNDTTPIFILGMPRSGSTLVEQILSSHPQVAGAGETNAMCILAFKALPYRTGKEYPHAVAVAAPELLQKLSTQYMKHLRKYVHTQKPFICDKMPVNFMLVGLIHILFPNARIIHCARDPMDTCWSIYKHFFLNRNPYAYDQKILGRFYLQYEQLMQHWNRVLPDRIFTVQYEQMVENTEATIRALLKHCGLPFADSCLHFYRTERPVATASAMQVRQPIYNTALKSWWLIAEQLAPLQKALGIIPL